ncbi:hypothetical protein LJC45_00955 [Alistipes sp. OttesenSCG-928-B03]|nr:hypothetical protein [Alistipes sp. OttesenSCG-928-B03]
MHTGDRNGYIAILEATLKGKGICYTLDESGRTLIVTMSPKSNSDIKLRCVFMLYPCVIDIVQVLAFRFEKEHAEKIAEIIGETNKNIVHGRFDYEEDAGVVSFSGEFDIRDSAQLPESEFAVSFFCDYFLGLLPQLHLNIYDSVMRNDRSRAAEKEKIN